MMQALGEGIAIRRIPFRKVLVWVVFLAVGVMIWGCAPAAPPAPTATPAPKAAPAVSPETKPTAAPKAAWEQEWEQLVAAARKEGKVVVAGPPGEGSRKALVDEFQKAYPGIAVDFSGAWGPENVPKISKERQAGQYLVDVYISGPQPALGSLKGTGAFEPLEPALILPDVKDPKKWRLGKLDFIDKEGKYYLGFSLYVGLGFLYNSDLVKPAEIKSWWDLADPKWKGKITMFDPTGPGSGQPILSFWNLHPDLGPRFIRAFLDPKHEVTLVREGRQAGEWIGRGKQTVFVGGSWVEVKDLARELPIKPYPLEQLKEGGGLTSGFGNVALMNRAPHPNAAKVYINWLLSKPGQDAYAVLTETPSGRVDAAKGDTPQEYIAKEGVNYFVEHHEETVAKRAEAVKIANEVLGR